MQFRRAVNLSGFLRTTQQDQQPIRTPPVAIRVSQLLTGFHTIRAAEMKGSVSAAETADGAWSLTSQQPSPPSSLPGHGLSTAKNALSVSLNMLMSNDDESATPDMYFYVMLFLENVLATFPGWVQHKLFHYKLWLVAAFHCCFLCYCHSHRRGVRTEQQHLPPLPSPGALMRYSLVSLYWKFLNLEKLQGQTSMPYDNITGKEVWDHFR